MKTLFTSLMIGSMLVAAPAFADDHKERPTKEQMQERKAHWESLSDAEKVKMIEEKRSSRISEMDEKWSKMSDAEKIAFAEEKRKNKHKKRQDKGE